MKTHLFLFAGEASGDMHGGRLLQALKAKSPLLHATGVAGPAMRLLDIECLIPMEEFQVMGFTDVALSLPRLIKAFKRICTHIIDTNPNAVILIDYPGFNLRLSKALRHKGYKGKIIHYISPSVWAWQQGRARTLEKYTDLLLTIYPFEKQCYNTTKLNVAYVGNPLKEYMSTHTYNADWKKILNIPLEPKIIALFPGSRCSEIKRNFPLQLQAAELLARETECIFVVSTTNSQPSELLRSFILKSSLKLGHNLFFVPKEFNYDLMREAHAAIAKSGTVTLELALHACPTVVTYELSWLNQAIAKYVLGINLPHYCIVNILANQTVFPELIGHGITPIRVYEQLMPLVDDTAKRSLCMEQCLNINKSLAESTASTHAADAIVNELAHA
jgi:lipid-A-disaccharide synthase